MATCALAGFLISVGAGCDGSGDSGGSGLRISLSATPPPAGTGDVVWIAEGGRSGGLLTVDVMARDLGGPFDGYSIEFSFDTGLIEAVSGTVGTVLSSCSPIAVLTADNIANGSANTSGTVLIAAALTGAPPPPCSLAGEEPLARILFRARGRGTSDLDFLPYNGDPVNPGGSVVFRSDPVFTPAPAQFFDSGALVEVTR